MSDRYSQRDFRAREEFYDYPNFGFSDRGSLQNGVLSNSLKDYTSKSTISEENMNKMKGSDSKDDVSVASLDSTGKTKSFRRLMVRFAEKTSMQGVGYINSAKFWWSRLIWIVLTLAAISVMVVHLYSLFDTYYSWPIVTKVSLGFENLPFPAVTLCNVNILKYSELYRMDRKTAGGLQDLVAFLSPNNIVKQNRRRKRFVGNLRNFNESAYDPESYRPEPKDSDISTETDEMSEVEKTIEKLLMEIPRHERAAAGHNISDMLISCSFDGRKCYAENFTIYQTSEYGNCWTLSSQKLKAKSSGPNAGMKMILYTENFDYLPGVTNGIGARVVIHDQDTAPFPADQGQYVSSSFETSIGLRRITLIRESGNYGDCEDGAAFEANTKLKYTRFACVALCEVEQLINACSCFGVTDEEFVRTQRNLRNYNICKSALEKQCMDNFQRNDFQHSSCICGNPCNENQYVKTFSSRQWPTDSYANVLIEGVCEKGDCDYLRTIDDKRSLSQNFLKLNIFYEDLNYEIIEEQPEIEFTQFLSDVGGAIGLWIGLSILSMCEIIQLVAELLDYAVHKCRKIGRRNERTKERQKRKHKEKTNDADRVKNNFGNREIKHNSPWEKYRVERSDYTMY